MGDITSRQGRVDVFLNEDMPCWRHADLHTKFGEDLLENHADLSLAQVVPMARRLRSMSEEAADKQDARGLATLRVSSHDEVKSSRDEVKSSRRGPCERRGSASSWQ